MSWPKPLDTNNGNAAIFAKSEFHHLPPHSPLSLPPPPARTISSLTPSSSRIEPTFTAAAALALLVATVDSESDSEFKDYIPRPTPQTAEGASPWSNVNASSTIILNLSPFSVFCTPRPYSCTAAPVWE
ncbi:hypothetical protein GALMADRAFT_148903 [Galerina marginata CBS 339.88]|uniref:Uncharacterized protein n=1 Tax=Galerina marginata (strain CBS 339.88) TaxID=685588 RepID=A0A067S2X7_GALM3|nr:hypothetical protein GALMADRAFT_148903 [Galerina marginata CBS 339.88]